MKLSEKVVLITGGGSGVGAAIARICAAEGARVIVIGRDEAKLRAVCDRLGDAATFFAADVTDRPRVKEVVDAVIADHGRLDILVNNAGVNVVDRALAKLTPENWDLQMDINVTGTFNLIHAVLPHMRERREGTIISISSLAGTHPSVLAGTAYSASKHGMSVLTKMVDLEESVNGIRATVISPGEINTPILDQRPVKVSDEHKAGILQPDDIAEAYYQLHRQPRSAWTQELDLRPWAERW